jgi:hypothetical protein
LGFVTVCVLSQPAVIIEEALIIPVLDVPVLSSEAGRDISRAIDSDNNVDRVVHTLEATKKLSTAAGTLLGVATGAKGSIESVGTSAEQHALAGAERQIGKTTATAERSALRDSAPGSGVASTPRNFSAVEPGPLPPKVAETFAGGRYTERVLQEETILYRVHGGRSGEIGRGGATFLSPNPQVGGLQSQIDLALRPEWGNTATQVTRIRIPKGTVIYEGPVSSQGGAWVGGTPQVYVPKIDPEWIIR